MLLKLNIVQQRNINFNNQKIFYNKKTIKIYFSLSSQSAKRKNAAGK